MTKDERLAEKLLRIGMAAANSFGAGVVNYDKSIPWLKIDKPTRAGWIAVAKHVHRLIEEGKK